MSQLQKSKTSVADDNKSSRSLQKSKTQIDDGKSAKSARQDEAPAEGIGGQMMGGIMSGGGMLMGGVASVGGALNPMQLMGSSGKKKRKDKNGYRSRNDIQFNDDESQDNGGSSEEDDEQAVMSKASLAYLKKEEKKLQKEVERTRALMEVEHQKIALGANSDQDVKPNKRFKNFNDVFSGLTRSKNVITQAPIVSCIITYDSKSAITVTKENDTEYMIKNYSLENYISQFEEKFTGTYIKMKEIEQNDAGNIFAAPYLDDGRFYIRFFTINDEEGLVRSEEEIKENELDINSALGLNDHTMPIDNFPDPFINCCFVEDTLIFVNLFHNATLTHHHFFYNTDTKLITSHETVLMQCNKKNFPQKCFFNENNNEIYTFYRQGQSFRIPVLDKPHDQNGEKQKYYEQKIHDKDLGAMFLVYEDALVVRCSSQILFFKLVLDEFTGNCNWVRYYTIDQGGFIYYIKGNARIQITTDTEIFFYKIDQSTLEPSLENTMFNFMNCSQMMFGRRVKYGITFKTNQKSFDIHRRKFEHDFRVNVVEFDLDGSRGLPIESMNAFLVSKVDKISFYDIDTFEEIKSCELKIPLLKKGDDEREPNEIISMQMSCNEQMLGVISGKNLIMKEQKPNQLFLFKRIKNADPSQMDKFVFFKKIILRDYPQFQKISMTFFFKTIKGREPFEIIFAKQDSIICLNFEADPIEIRTICTFQQSLSKQPEFFTINHDQTVSIVASVNDGILYYYNLNTQLYIDLLETFELSDIKELIYDFEGSCFYLLANKYQDKLGVFIIKFDEADPSNCNFFMKYKNKLQITDADIAVLRCEKNRLKELILSYKTIHSNIYTVMVVDISRETPWPLYRHESFQLWESQITAFYISKNREYVMINRDGISVISLGSEGKRSIKAQNGQEKMIHPLESTNYLKVESDNYIKFEFAGEKKVIQVLQQFNKKNSKTGEETAFDQIYKICISNITLRELLLFQSLYVCNTQSDILKLVKSQADPRVFLKSFLELDGTNMVSILAFDSRSMSYILDDGNAEFFDQNYPLFYKNKIPKTNNKDKFYYRSAIDNALRTNQVSAIGSMITYITKYQNNFVSSFLFINNFNELLEKGVELSPLVSSEVFRFQFDYDDWPSTHHDETTYYRPYNGSIFDIRNHYRTIFHEKKFAVQDEDMGPVADSSKVYKIKYIINTLTQLSEYVSNEDLVTGEKTLNNEDVSLLTLVSCSDEQALFETNEMNELITFKWQSYARNFHKVGCFFHFAYLTIMLIYVNAIYINNNTKDATLFGILLIIGIIFPMCYDLTQLYRSGVTEYFQDAQNYSDQLYVWCSVMNVISQNSTDSQAFYNKILMTIIFLQQIIKSFFYLRIFKSLSFLVTMIYTVIADLKVFLLFFSILIVLFAQIFAVLGVGNPKQDGAFREYVEAVESGEEDGDIPMSEYDNIGLFMGYLFYTLRIAMGDFDFDASTYLTVEENAIYWAIWLLVVVLTCIIFLNFIIAEASASYAKVKDNLIAMINKEKSSLIGEAESMIPAKYKTSNLFPKYIIIRKVES